MKRSGGIAIVAVLALLAATALLMLSYSTLAAVNWLSARNLREGVHAWAHVEAAVAVVVSELEEDWRRNSVLPETYVLSDADSLGATVAYARVDDARARLVVVARYGKAAVRRSLVLDMEL